MNDREQWVNRIHEGECREVMDSLPESSIHCCVTSPPYLGQRDYDHDEQIGLEDSFVEYVQTLVGVGRSIRRVLRPDGSWWLNLGDAYAGSTGRGNQQGAADPETGYAQLADGDGGWDLYTHRDSTLPSKCKQLIPHRVAIALIDDGWLIRNDAVWRKAGGGMPESVKDRLSTTFEYVFHLVPQGEYWYDLDAIREPYSSKTMRMVDEDCKGGKQSTDDAPDSHWINDPEYKRGDFLHASGKNPGDLFVEPTASFPDAHFAVYPESLVEPLLKATCPPMVCAACGTPYTHIVERRGLPDRYKDRQSNSAGYKRPGDNPSKSEESSPARDAGKELLVDKGWSKGCDCETDTTESGIVLDPFAGAGTTCKVAKDHGRRFVGIDLNAEYVSMAQARCGLDVNDPSVLSEDGQDDLGSFATDGGSE
jgi:DNA modification methylase